MTLCKMALSNIKSNFKNYWAYFLSSSFSVFVIYLFTAITYDKNVHNTLGTMRSAEMLFDMGSWLAILFSAFFIWYSNSFFTKARKKEFATYMLLGMSNKQVSRLNFIENLIITIMSFLVGIILGVIFNKFFIMLLFVLIKTQGKAQFQFSLKAFKLSAVVFAVIFVIISIQSYLIICKSKLIDMFNASKKIEKGLKISIITVVLGVISLTCMCYGYYISIKKLGDNILLAPKAIITIVIGTILFFTAVTAIIIDAIKRNQKYLFKGTRLISVSQIHQRYRGNVGSLSVITITTTIALCALLFCWGSFNKAVKEARILNPLSVEYINGNANTDKIFNDILNKHKEISIKNKANMEFVYVSAKVPFTKEYDNILLLNQSMFNKVNSYENSNRKVNLKSNECYYVQIQDLMGDPKNAIGKNINFKFADKSYNVKVKNTDNKYFISIDHTGPAIIVNDEVYNSIRKVANAESIYKITGYTLKDDFKAEKFTNDLSKKIPKENKVATFYEHYTGGMKVIGVMAFIGLFIGILFIMATGSIIYFKMSMEAIEDKRNFVILREIGVSKNETTSSIAKEILILFGVPFLVASLNCYVASFSISKFFYMKVTKEFIIIEIIYLLIYSIYYLITLRKYVRTISE
ncbi:MULTISPECIES: FtsX-like permease family protein [Clostridium]|uniref:FtsX-like permease family protein n=1 Tax=Clostridium TaxID=1485 RepID=UPI0008268CA5|nr:MULTISPECIES: ABC transporter permease [Clostridium]PJI08129.1 ABC transporter permease [Clostridium sp. CT7]